MDEPMTDLKELSEDLGIPRSTLSTWITKFDIPVHRSGNRTKFDTEAQALIRTIKQLRDLDCGFDTITRKIDTSRPSDGNALFGRLGATEADFRTLVTDAVRQTLLENDSVSEKLSRATYTIGQQEERIKNLERDLLVAQEKVQFLLPPEKLDLVNQEVIHLKEALAVEKKKTWWQKLLGG